MYAQTHKRDEDRHERAEERDRLTISPCPHPGVAGTGAFVIGPDKNGA